MKYLPGTIGVRNADENPPMPPVVDAACCLIAAQNSLDAGDLSMTLRCLSRAQTLLIGLLPETTVDVSAFKR